MNIYSTLRWRTIRARAIARDGHRCTVSRLLGGACSGGPLHAHHIEPVSEGGAPFDIDNVGTACARHHPQWEALRREVMRRRTSGEADVEVRCPHQHRSSEARRICEARMARARAGSRVAA